jgi:hypothetical protein
VSVANNGQKFSIGTDYRTATIPLRAESTCPGTVSWNIEFRYATTKGKGTSKSGPHVINDSLRAPSEPGAYDYQTPVGAGGLVNVTATITIDGKTARRGVTFYVDGVTIPPSTINDRLVQLYQGGNNRLMTGVAAKESGTRQFGRYGQPFALYSRSGMWPFESYDGGSHVGIMMVATKMTEAFDWHANTQGAINLFVNDKLGRAQNYQTFFRNSFPQLRVLTLQERELDALVFYGPASVNVYSPCNGCVGGIQGAYWVPNAKRTDWIVNPRHKRAIDYVRDVLEKVQ